MMEFIAKNAAIIGTLFFFTIFCAIAIYVIFAPKMKKKSKDYANIPLKDKD